MGGLWSKTKQQFFYNSATVYRRVQEINVMRTKTTKKKKMKIREVFHEAANTTYKQIMGSFVCFTILLGTIR